MPLDKRISQQDRRIYQAGGMRLTWPRRGSMWAFAALFFVVTMGQALAQVPNAVPPVGTHNGDDVLQPIIFPHDVHAKINQINCMYCHTYARRSRVAGIPPTSKCMGCHSVIATDKERIIALTKTWTDKKPFLWKKVSDVPDYVTFSHEKHLQRFVFENEGMDVSRVSEVCAFCHGDVKEMTVANKTKPLNMGFCRRCHESNGGPADCWQCHK